MVNPRKLVVVFLAVVLSLAAIYNTSFLFKMSSMGPTRRNPHFFTHAEQEPHLYSHTGVTSALDASENQVSKEKGSTVTAAVTGGKAAAADRVPADRLLE
eukprot:4944680-Pyramimonas_sp.AAC.3